MSKVVIYTASLCPYCHRAKELLRGKGVAFEEIDITASPAQRLEMRGKAGGRNTVPQIFIGDVHVGGCDDLHGLDRAGELDQMLRA